MRRLPLLFLLFFLAMAIPAHATIAYVQGVTNGTNGPSTTITLTYPSNNTAGCLLIVTAVNISNRTTDMSIMDTAGDTFTKLHSYYGLSPVFAFTEAWETTSCVGGANVVTITGNNGGWRAATDEYSGTSITLDQEGIWTCGGFSNAGTAGVIASPVAYTSNANELLYAWGYKNLNGVTLSASNSYTIRQQGGNATQGTLAVADRNVSSTGGYSTIFSGGAGSGQFFSGAATFSEGGSVTVPAIEQVACGDQIEPWHELGTFSGKDIVLNKQKSGDYIFVGYRVRPPGSGINISNTNGYTWNLLQSSNNFSLWYAVVPMDKPAGDVITFGIVNYDNAGRVVEIHGLSGLPTLVSTSATSDTMALTIAPYTTPSYCVTSMGCATPSKWYGTMLNTQIVVGDYIVASNSDGAWLNGTIPGTSTPGTAGIDLFPTDLHFMEMWLPGAPLPPPPTIVTKHHVQVY